MRRRAFSLFESVLVLVLVALLYLAVSVNFTGDQTQGPVRQAQTVAAETLAAEQQWIAAHGTTTFPTNPTALSTVTPSIDFVSGTTPSTSDTTASVDVATATSQCPDQCVGVAVAGVDPHSPTSAAPYVCWFVLEDVAAPTSELPTVYAYNSANDFISCTGAEAVALANTASSSSAGATPGQPLQLSLG